MATAPWGLVNNVRCNHRGRDLNRDFQNPRIELVREWRKIVTGRHFDLALDRDQIRTASVPLRHAGTRGRTPGPPEGLRADAL